MTLKSRGLGWFLTGQKRGKSSAIGGASKKMGLNERERPFWGNKRQGVKIGGGCCVWVVLGGGGCGSGTASQQKRVHYGGKKLDK